MLELDDIFILLDRLNEHERRNITKRLAEELSISDEEALGYVKQWLYHNGE